jgi:16S rRNA A1518/A1519 N6-dimethyltransferase RsmA/KsgA/DIM1 with predicted DNA glycosylase/AP lyase activity
LKGRLDKPEIDEILAEMELADDARTEQLDVPTLLRLAELVRKQAPQWSLT